MAVTKEKSCKTCALNKRIKCEIGYKKGFEKGGCGAWIFRKEREDG